MIRRIENIDEIKLDLRDSHYSRLILAHIKTYGTDFDFCEVFEISSAKKRIGFIVCFNATMVADITENAHVTQACLRELKEFISFKCPYTVEICPELCTKMGFKGYSKIKRTFFDIIKGTDDKGLALELDYDAVFSTVFDPSKESFGLWLTDTARRVNRNLSRLYSYESSVLTVRYFLKNFAYITDVATPESDRGKGFGRSLLQKAAFVLENEGYKPYLTATDETAGYYRSLYFPETGQDYIYKLKD